MKSSSQFLAATMLAIVVFTVGIRVIVAAIQALPYTALYTPATVQPAAIGVFPHVTSAVVPASAASANSER